MTHVTDKIQAWLSGELDPETASSLEQHLEGCPDCAAEAVEARRMWDLLGGLESPVPAAAASVWPAVRAKTLAEAEAGAWFFGTGRLVRSSLAAAAVAAGLVLGVFLPGAGHDKVGGTAEARPVTADQVEVAWLSDSTWGGGLAEVQSSWLNAGQDQATGQENANQEGAR